MIEIESMTAVLPKVQRKRKAKALSKMERRTVDRYRDAYRRVYGIKPDITKEGKWYRVHGQTNGVNRARLLEMARQLEYRAGDTP